MLRSHHKGTPTIRFTEVCPKCDSLLAYSDYPQSHRDNLSQLFEGKDSSDRDNGRKVLLPLFHQRKVFPDEIRLVLLQCNHPFQQHHAPPGKTYGNNIKPLRLWKRGYAFPTEIDASVSISGLHTRPFQEERRTDIAKKQISNDCNRLRLWLRILALRREKRIGEIFD